MELNPIAKQRHSGLIPAQFPEPLLPPKRSKLVNVQSRVPKSRVSESYKSRKFIAALAKGLEKSKDKEWLLNKGIPSFNTAQNPSITFVKLTPEQSKKLHLPEVLPAATENGLKYVSEQLLRHGPIKELPKDFNMMLHQSDRTPVAK